MINILIREEDEKNRKKYGQFIQRILKNEHSDSLEEKNAMFKIKNSTGRL